MKYKQNRSRNAFNYQTIKKLSPKAEFLYNEFSGKKLLNMFIQRCSRHGTDGLVYDLAISEIEK